METNGRIGVIFPHISGNVDTSFIEAIYRKAKEYGYDTLVITGAINCTEDTLDWTYNKGQNNIYDLILYGGFDGFIFEADFFCSEKQRKIILELLRRKNRPCVVVNYEQPYFSVVSADETIPLRLAAEHLINEHDCRKLYCIGGYKGHQPSEERISGFRTAMDNACLEYDDSNIFYGNYWRDIPRQIALDIAEGKISMPDGIVCGSDIMAVALIRTLTENGIRVPEDIKVTGCDGSLITQNERISVTTVANQEKLNGALAVSRLLEMLGNEISDYTVPVEVVIAESCGCAEKGKIFRSESLSDIREYEGVIFDMLEHRRTSIHGEISRRMSECNDIYDVTGTFLGCYYMLPTATKAELCLCTDWYRNLNDPTIYRRSGYSGKMILAMESGSDFSENMMEFSTEDIFPSLKKPHEPRLTVLTSIHYKGQIFGYVGFTYKKAAHIIADEFYMTWCDAVSSGLNTVQNKMYKEFVNNKIESLSEYAPVLGIYNRRGLISRMVGLMSANNRDGCLLVLISYIREERVKYTVPPLNSIVNAMRLSDTGCILASINEDIIAVVVNEDNTSASPHEIAKGIADTVEKSYKGAIVLKAGRVAVIKSEISQANILDIDSIISRMTEELKGKIMNFSSGMISYRDSLMNLRDDIYRSPELDWNIETISRDIGISRSHFHRLYKEIFSTSCKEDIISSRIEKAKWLLGNTVLPITQIAEQCGYLNTSHFIRQFHNRINMSPSDYRRQTPAGSVTPPASGLRQRKNTPFGNPLLTP